MIFIGILFSFLGASSFIVGLLFLIASQGSSSRLFTGFILLLISVVLIVLGIKFILKAIKNSPTFIKSKILKLAKINNGSFTDEILLESLGNSFIVESTMKELLENKVSEEKVVNERKQYVFEDFQQKILEKKCPYCGNDFDINKMTETCPGCGGDLKLKSSQVSAGNLYSMDEGE